MDQKIIDTLKKAGLTHELYQHPPFSSCEISSAWHKDSGRPGQRVKNLFLRNKNGKQHFLLMLPHALDFDKATFKSLSGQKCGLASDDRLWEYLKVKPGAVSPLALIHDAQQHVQVFVEKSLTESPALHLHPGRAEWSVQITPADMMAFLKSLGYEVNVVEWKISDLSN